MQKAKKLGYSPRSPLEWPIYYLISQDMDLRKAFLDERKNNEALRGLVNRKIVDPNEHAYGETRIGQAESYEELHKLTRMDRIGLAKAVIISNGISEEVLQHFAATINKDIEDKTTELGGDLYFNLRTNKIVFIERPPLEKKGNHRFIRENKIFYEGEDLIYLSNVHFHAINKYFEKGNPDPSAGGGEYITFVGEEIAGGKFLGDMQSRGDGIVISHLGYQWWFWGKNEFNIDYFNGRGIIDLGVRQATPLLDKPKEQIIRQSPQPDDKSKEKVKLLGQVFPKGENDMLSAHKLSLGEKVQYGIGWLIEKVLNSTSSESMAQEKRKPKIILSPQQKAQQDSLRLLNSLDGVIKDLSRTKDAGVLAAKEVQRLVKRRIDIKYGSADDYFFKVQYSVVRKNKIVKVAMESFGANFFVFDDLLRQVSEKEIYQDIFNAYIIKEGAMIIDVESNKDFYANVVILAEGVMDIRENLSHPDNIKMVKRAIAGHVEGEFVGYKAMIDYLQRKGVSADRIDKLYGEEKSEGIKACLRAISEYMKEYKKSELDLRARIMINLFPLRSKTMQAIFLIGIHEGTMQQKPGVNKYQPVFPSFYQFLMSPEFNLKGKPIESEFDGNGGAYLNPLKSDDLGINNTGFRAESPIEIEFERGGPLSKFAGNKGGIDLNPANIDLQIQGQGVEFNWPTDPAQIEKMNIPGLYPVILNVTPVTNLPLLLGVVSDCEENGQPAGAGQNHSKCPAVSYEKSSAVKGKGGA